LTKISNKNYEFDLKTLNGNLAPNEEDIVAETLAELGELVRKYKLQVFPYFKDYDRVSIENLF